MRFRFAGRLETLVLAAGICLPVPLARGDRPLGAAAERGRADRRRARSRGPTRSRSTAAELQSSSGAIVPTAAETVAAGVSPQAVGSVAPPESSPGSELRRDPRATKPVPARLPRVPSRPVAEPTAGAGSERALVSDCESRRRRPSQAPRLRRRRPRERGPRRPRRRRRRHRTRLRPPRHPLRPLPRPAPAPTPTTPIQVQVPPLPSRFPSSTRWWRP